MKNILIPTDFSGCANAAAQFGIQLAKITDAKIELLHIISTPIDWAKIPLGKEKNYPETIKQIGNAKNELSKWIKKAIKKNVKVSQFLTFNKGNDEIFNHTQTHHSDLIIMGSHGSKGFKELVMGSNAQQIIRKSTIPVLIIKSKVEKPIKNILFVSDFKDVSQDAFSKITHFADILNAHIELLFVNTPNEFSQTIETDKNMNSVLKHCKREDKCTKNIINAISVEQGIQDFIKNKAIDIISISTHGKSGLHQLFSPSITEKIANHSELPLLSIKL